MRSISRRIRMLEEQRFGTAADIEFSRRLLERMAEGRRRVAEAKKERGELWDPVGDDKEEDLAGLTMTQILHRGRARVARAKAAREAAQLDTASKGDV